MGPAAGTGYTACRRNAETTMRAQAVNEYHARGHFDQYLDDELRGAARSTELAHEQNLSRR